MIKNIFKKVQGFSPVELVLMVGFAALAAGALIYLGTTPHYMASSQPVNVNVKVDGSGATVSRTSSAQAAVSTSSDNSDYAFEILAIKPIGEPAAGESYVEFYNHKELAINEAIDMLQAKIAALSDVEIVKSDPPVSEDLRYGYMESGVDEGPNDPNDLVFGDEFFYGRGGYVWRDYNGDGLVDDFHERESGKAVTVRFPADEGLLKAAGPRFALMLPWTISVYSGTNPNNPTDYHNDHIYVIAQVPDTFVRLFMRDAANYQGWLGVAKSSHDRIRDLVRETFDSKDGWVTDVNMGMALMDEATVNEVEGLLGSDYQLTIDAIAHKAKVGTIDTDPTSPTYLTVDSVVTKLVTSIIAGPALFQTDDNPPGINDEEVHNLFYLYMIGQKTLQEFFTQLGAWAGNAWMNYKTILKFTGVRVLDSSLGSAMKLKVVEMCQPFYGHTSLSLGLHHAPSLPDTFAIWEEDGSVWIAGFDITFLFPFFWHDVLNGHFNCYDALPENRSHMCPVLNAFGGVLNNEVGTMVNRALGGYFFPVEM